MRSYKVHSKSQFLTLKGREAITGMNNTLSDHGGDLSHTRLLCSKQGLGNSTFLTIMYGPVVYLSCDFRYDTCLNALVSSSGNGKSLSIDGLLRKFKEMPNSLVHTVGACQMLFPLSLISIPKSNFCPSWLIRPPLLHMCLIEVCLWLESCK